MRLRALLKCVILFVVLTACGAVQPAPPADPLPKGAMTVHDTWSVPGIFGGGVKASNAYVDGSFFLTVPIYSSIGQDGRLAGDVIFIEPYTSWGEEGEVAMSLGVGWRHLFSDQSVSAVTKHDGHQAGFFEEGAFIGANVFVDMLDTQFDNRFWQLGFGVEAGTRYVEMRANYYVPLSGRELAEEIRTRERFASQRRSIRQEVTYDEPFATGHTIAQDATFRTLETTVTRTTTVDRITRLFEEGMEGFDVELGLLMPGLDRWMDVKVIGGYYSFDNQPFGPQTGGTGRVKGWKAGLEARPVPAVVLNGTWYEDDRLTGSDWTAGVRLEIPFEAGDLGDGKGLWDRVGDAFRPRRRHLVERMAEPVRRQNAAIKTSHSVEQESKQTTDVKVVTKVVSQSKQRIVLADTVVFVDNAIGKATNPGTYEAPVDTITNGENLGNLAFGNSAVVFVQGQPKSYTESVTISQGARLFGSGSFPALGGKVFHGRTNLMPTVSGGFYAQNVPSTVQVTGFTIRDGLVGTPDSAVGVSSEGAAIFFEDVLHGIITKNHVSPSKVEVMDIYVETNSGSSQFLISDNTVDGMIHLIARGSANVTAEVSRNIATGKSFGSAIAILAGGNAVGNFMVTGNIASGLSGGMYLTTVENASAVFTVADNHVAGSGMWGVDLLAYDNSSATFVVTSNQLIGNDSHGLFVMAADPGASVNIFLSGNTIHFNKGDQMGSRNLGGTLNFLSDGALSNDLREAPGNIGQLHNAISGSESGFIFINGLLHPASLSLP
jgi:hypothetical protein